jgi:uncharacterized repeat protein (TIGR01451 family)
MPLTRVKTSAWLLLAASIAASLPACRTAPFRARLQDAPIRSLPILPGTPQPTLPPAVTVPGLPGSALPPATTYPPGAYPPTSSYSSTVTPLPAQAAPYGAATTQRPATISLSKRGPTQGAVGETLTYRIEVRNSGAAALRDVTVSDQLAAGLTLLGSNPPASSGGNVLQWRLGDVQSGETRVIEVQVRPERSGVFNSCATVRTADGQSAQDCASTSVLTAELDVQMSVRTAEPVQVGQKATFEIIVSNRSALPATGLLITDRYDAGLDHESQANPIERDLDRLEPGQSRKIGVTFTVTREGQLCNDVTVSGVGGVRGSARACIVAAAATEPPPDRPPDRPPTDQPPVTKLPPTQPPPAGQASEKRASVAVKMTGPETIAVAGVAEFQIEITNNGDVDLTRLQISDTFDASLNPVQATQGYTWEKDTLVWNFPSLAAGKTLRLQVNCRGQAAAARACNRIAVTSDQKAAGEAEACLSIRAGGSVPPVVPPVVPPAAGSATESQLSVEVNDLADPVVVGKEVTYEIRVKNSGKSAEQNIKVLAILPAELTLIRLGTHGPGRYDVDMERNIRFQTLKEIKPGETLTYRVRARAQQAGEVSLQVVYETASMEKSKTVEEKTTLFDNP